MWFVGCRVERQFQLRPRARGLPGRHALRPYRSFLTMWVIWLFELFDSFFFFDSLGFGAKPQRKFLLYYYNGLENGAD